MRSALLAGLVGALAIAAVAAGAGGGKRLVRISGASPIPRACDGATAQRGSEVEPTLAIDPRRGRRSLVAAWQQDRYVRGGGAAALGMAYSRDGGSSWKRARVPGITGCRGRSGRTSDPWLSTGPEGTVYLASLPGRVTPRDGLRTTVAVSVSRDGGASWSAPTTIARAGSRFNDKETVTADPTRPGHAYLVWSQLDRIRFTRTLDAGRTWSRPRTIASGFEVNIAAISVLADGTLLHAFVRTGLRHDAFFVARSRNGGASWSRFRAVPRVRDLAPRRGRYSVRTEPL